MNISNGPRQLRPSKHPVMEGIIIAFTIIVVGLIVYALAAYLLHHRTPPHRTVATQAEPCSADTDPCVKLTTEDGTSYKFNDFQFAPGHCINFLSLPGRISRKLCGNYKLDWIGPDGSSTL